MEAILSCHAKSKSVVSRNGLAWSTSPFWHFLHSSLLMTLWLTCTHAICHKDRSVFLMPMVCHSEPRITDCKPFRFRDSQTFTKHTWVWWNLHQQRTCLLTRPNDWLQYIPCGELSFSCITAIHLRLLNWNFQIFFADKFSPFLECHHTVSHRSIPF